jgi:hypothetical protein
MHSSDKGGNLEARLKCLGIMYEHGVESLNTDR